MKIKNRHKANERNTCRKGATESETINKKEKRSKKHTGSVAQTRENGYPEKGVEKKGTEKTDLGTDPKASYPGVDLVTLCFNNAAQMMEH